MISVNQISKNYGSIQAIRDVSFDVSAGKILGLLGPNGAGKTTTMRVLTCFMPPTSGSASVAGFDILENPVEVRRHIGYMPENPPVYPELEVTAFLRFVAEIKEVPREQVQRRVEVAMEKVHITHIRGRVIGHLSRGYRQRVGLAQALVHDPKVLVLDEPTLGLDPSQIIEIRELIRGLAGHHTVILSSHILPEVQATCQEVAIIHHGKIVAKDTMENLTVGQRLQVKFKSQADGILKALTEVQGVENVVQQPGSENNFRVDFKGRMEEICEAIYLLSVKKNWLILEMSGIRTSLEEIFLRTTAGEILPEIHEVSHE